jgi:hypothetical protein
MKKLGIVIMLILAVSCFAVAAFAVDITPQAVTASVSATFLGLPNPGFSAIASAASIVLGLSAASVVVFRKK